MGRLVILNKLKHFKTLKSFGLISEPADLHFCLLHKETHTVLVPPGVSNPTLHHRLALRQSANLNLQTYQAQPTFHRI